MKKRKRPKSHLISIIIIGILLIFCVNSDHYRRDIQKSVETQSKVRERDRLPKEEIQGKELGPVTLLPPIIAVIVAFVTREVLTSLIAGLLSGFFILNSVGLSGPFHLIRSVMATLISACQSIIGVVGDYWNASIILLCFSIGGLVAVINKTGGFQALAQKLICRIKTPKGAGYIGELLGCLIFFDDYANSLIIGPVMQPLTDKLKISREKLAFIVDSTAAPVAGIAVISSWVAAEVGIITEGLKMVGMKASAYNLFLGSIPYCFYNIFCLVFMLFLTKTGREYGPMLMAERRARQGKPQKTDENLSANNIMDMEAFQVKEGVQTNFLTAVIPIMLLIALSFVGFYFDGLGKSVEAGLLAENAAFNFTTLRIAIGNADTAEVMFIASVVASGAAILMGKKRNCFSYKEGVDIWLEGVKSLLITVIILVLAWAMSDAVGQLGTCYFIVEIVRSGVPYWLIPSLIFIVCCAISFAVGSYGTMLIAMPIVIPIAYSMCGQAFMIGHPEQFICMCIASVLAGSIFGDHCSPITDTTILSSIGSGCNNLDHVKTQIPYAITVAAVSVLCGTLPAGLGVSPMVSLVLGILVCAAAIRIFGKKIETEKCCSRETCTNPEECHN